MLLAAGDAIKRKQAALKAAREDAPRPAARARRRRRRRARRRRRTRRQPRRPRRPPRRPRRRCACMTSTRCSGSRCRCTRRAACCGSMAAAGGGGEQPAGLFDDDSGALHLYGAAPDPGWAQPARAACRGAARRRGRRARVEHSRSRPTAAPAAGAAAARRRRGRRAPQRACRALRAPPPLTATRMLLESLGYAEAEQVAVEGGGKIDFTAASSH